MEYVRFGNAGMAKAIALTVVASIFVVTVVAADEANLVPNGGFEQDSDGDGVPDGWLGQPHNFSRETLEEVQAYIDSLPSHEELLKGEEVLAADGWPIATRKPDEPWGAYVQTAEWYQRLQNEYLPQDSRFGQLPVPEGLDLGTTTCVIHNLKPHDQTISVPIAVKANTGYRLSYWFRMSSGAQTVMFQIIDADAPRNQAWPTGSTEARRRVISGKSLGWGWVPHWRRYEIPFRTGPEETAIRLRLWIYFVGYEDHRRMWYDDFRLVEDDSVVVGEIADPVNPEPQWPEEVVNRGYAVVPRPALPVTYHTYMPRLEELSQPLRLSLAAGETGSAVIFVRSLGEDITVRASPGALVSDNGYGLANDYGARFIYVRAAEETKLALDFQRYLIRPEFLRHSNELALEANEGGQFWLTVQVPQGTPPGRYTGEITITPIGGEEKATRLPVVLTVPDIELSTSDVAFGTWRDISPLSGERGPINVLPGSDEIYLADQRRHGMNTVGTYCMAERKDKEGNFHVAFPELDAMVQNVQRAGLCRDHPLLLHTWREDMVGGEFGQLAGGTQAILDIYGHGKETGWPDLLFYVLDEPGGGERAKRVIEVMKDYTPARRRGVRTVTAGPNPNLQGHLYDVWIVGVGTSNWEELFALADKHGSEVWMYDCGYTGRNSLLERFYAGLFTWRTGVKGNMVWSYGWYVRINDQGLPESKLAWEARLSGVNDYRYLQALEETLAAATTSGQGRSRAVRAARRFLQRLRAQIPVDVYIYEKMPAQRSGELVLFNPAPEIEPEDYDRIRQECVRHIQDVRALLPKP